MGAGRVTAVTAVTAVTGIVVAAIAMLVANKALPADLAHLDDWERGAFWAAWLLALGHAWWRTAAVKAARIAPAWREQCWAIVVLALAAVVLDAVVTGDHLLRTIGNRYRPVAGLDQSMLVAAGIATFAAIRLRQRERVAPTLAAEPAGVEFDDAAPQPSGALPGAARA